MSTILEETWQVQNYLECTVCHKPVLMLPGDTQDKCPAHVFCWMWGHSIEDHDYEHNCKKGEWEKKHENHN